MSVSEGSGRYEQTAEAPGKDMRDHFDVLEHVEDQQAFIDECRDLLKPEGKLSIGVLRIILSCETFWGIP
jgi:hypothetical protein